MTAQIKILKESTINKIAAGEVIERPASVVKELVENSIDAEAKAIQIEIKNGGLDLIRITDNGRGMDKADLSLCITRHATSKISNFEDIYDTNSLGFRGEALPSITSVSKIKIASKTNDTKIGNCLSCEGNKIIEFGPCAGEEGTDIWVSDLFFNTPVRKKFLKTGKTENSYINDTIENLIIPHIHIGFTIKNNLGKEQSFPKTNSYLDRIIRVFGKEFKDSLIQIEEETPSFHVHGFISKPTITKPTQRYLKVFIKGRYIRDKVINHAIRSAYSELIPQNRFPMGVLFIDVPGKDIDINIHPTKREVKFKDSGSIHDFVYKSIRKILREIKLESTSHEEVRTKSDKTTQITPFPQNRKRIINFEIPQVEIEAPQTTFYGIAKDLPYKLIGQIMDSFVVCEKDNKLIIIDQHAAFERIAYEELKCEYFKGKVKSQLLAFSENIEIPNLDDYIANTLVAETKKMGFDIDVFSSESFIVRATPTILSNADIKTLVKDLYDEYKENIKNYKLDSFIDKILFTIACHTTVRANQKLSQQEMENMLEKIDKIDFSLTCPHGRPVFTEITREELEKRFKRR